MQPHVNSPLARRIIWFSLPITAAIVIIAYVVLHRGGTQSNALLGPDVTTIPNITLNTPGNVQGAHGGPFCDILDQPVSRGAVPNNSAAANPDENSAARLVLSDHDSLIGYDDFDRSNRLLTGDVAPSGQRYTYQGGTNTQGPSKAFQPFIVGDKYILNPCAAFTGDETAGWTILRMRQARTPTIVAGTFDFTRGSSTSNQEFVLITSAPDQLKAQSDQLYVTPNLWVLLTVVNGHRYRVGQGSFPKQLAMDGKTTYAASMSLNATANTLVIAVPEGGTRTFTNADFARYWGSQFAVQLQVYKTSGNVECVGIASGGP